MADHPTEQHAEVTQPHQAEAPAAIEPARADDHSQRRFRFARLYPLLLVLIGVLVYQNTFHNAFIFDDLESISRNPNVRRVMPISRFFSQGRPLLYLSLAINYELGELNVVGYHLVNTAIHILAALALLGVVRRTLASPVLRPKVGAAAPHLAFAIALIWLVHPLCTQAVNYVIQRGESMMGLFMLLTLYCAIRAFEQPASQGSPTRYLWQALAIVACFLGMASKEVMAAAPLLVLLYDRTFFAGSFLGSLRHHAAMYVGMFASWIVLWEMFGVSASIEGTSRYASAGFALDVVGPLQYFLSQPGVILHYLRLSIWPHPLLIDYEWWPATEVWQVVPQFITVSLLGLATLWAIYRRSWLGVVGAWFFLILGPTSSFVPIADLAVEHRMYLPLIAVIVLVAAAGWRLWVNLARRVDFATARAVGVAMLVLVTALLAWRTIDRNRDYRSLLSIWEATAQAAPDNARAQHNYAAALYLEGRFDEAEPHWQRAVELAPIYADPRRGLGLVALQREDYDEAIRHFRKAITLPGRAYKSHYDLARAHAAKGDAARAEYHYRQLLDHGGAHVEARNNLASLLVEQGRFDEAIEQYQRAIEALPDYPLPRLNLARVYRRQGKLEQAAEQLQAILLREPGHAEALVELSRILAKQKRHEQAYRLLQEAVRLNPDQAQPQRALADFLADHGRFEQSLPHYERAAALDASNSATHNSWAIALASAGHKDRAIARFQAALALDPDNAYAMANLASLLREAGDVDRAYAHASRAVALEPDNARWRVNLAQLLIEMREPAEALVHAETAMAMAPQQAQAVLTLAWILATADDAAVRDGERSLALAQGLVGAQESDARVLVVLAAARAEVGDFAAAASAVERAAERLQNDDARQVLRGRREAYLAGSAVRGQAMLP